MNGKMSNGFLLEFNSKEQKNIKNFTPHFVSYCLHSPFVFRCKNGFYLWINEIDKHNIHKLIRQDNERHFCGRKLVTHINFHGFFFVSIATATTFLIFARKYKI